MNNILLTYKIIYNKLVDILSIETRSSLSLISAFLLMMISRSILTIMDTVFIQDEFPLQRIIFILCTSLLIMGIEVGYTKFVFQFIDRKNQKISFIFNQFSILGKYISGLLIYYGIALLCAIPGFLYLLFKYGIDFFNILSSVFLDPYFQELSTSYINFNELLVILILISVPSTYLMIRLIFWNYFIIDKKLNPINAIKESWLLTKNKNTEILILGIGLLFFNILGAFTIIGICITIPLSYLLFCIYFIYLLSNNS